MTGTVGTPTPTGQTTGAIMDLGVVNADAGVRQMNVTLTDVSISISGSTDGNPVQSSQVTMNVYTDQDGLLTDGTYNYSDGSTSIYTPFTFTTASLYMPSADQSNMLAYDLVSGSVSVVHSGTSYDITFDGTLSNGNTIVATYNGNVSYMDSTPTY